MPRPSLFDEFVAAVLSRLLLAACAFGLLFVVAVCASDPIAGLRNREEARKAACRYVNPLKVRLADNTVTLPAFVSRPSSSVMPISGETLFAERLGPYGSAKANEYAFCLTDQQRSPLLIRSLILMLPTDPETQVVGLPTNFTWTKDTWDFRATDSSFYKKWPIHVSAQEQVDLESLPNERSGRVDMAITSRPHGRVTAVTYVPDSSGFVYAIDCTLPFEDRHTCTLTALDTPRGVALQARFIHVSSADVMSWTNGMQVPERFVSAALSLREMFDNLIATSN